MHGRPYAQYRPAYPRYPRRDPQVPGKPPAWRPRGRQAGEVSAVDAVGAGLRTRWPDRSGRVGALGLALADVPLRLALAVRAEEEHDITAAARRVILPAPVRPL